MIENKPFLEEFDEMPIEEAKKSKRKRKAKKYPFSSIIYTTGDVGLNIDRFNKAMGSFGLEHDSAGSDEADAGDFGSVGGDSGCCEALTEAKRYVRRYYIRPFNEFCSNKAEIIKALINHEGQNCTVYTLNNLGDEKDVTKLMNNDIIYYYDDGILYDKNHVRIFDYDLSVKREEDRKKLDKVDDESKEFKDTYEDRMTATTGFEESFTPSENSILSAFIDCDYDIIGADFTTQGDKIVVSLNHNATNIKDVAKELMICLSNAGFSIEDWNTNGSNVFIFDLSVNSDDAFNLDFDDVNVYGESLTEAKHENCCICGEPLNGDLYNPEPYTNIEDGRACESCYYHFVMPLRVEEE